MSKPQITVRLSPSLLNSLNEYVEETGSSKTDVVASALSQYLGCAENIPLVQRLAELERRMVRVETQIETN